MTYRSENIFNSHSNTKQWFSLIFWFWHFENITPWPSYILCCYWKAWDRSWSIQTHRQSPAQVGQADSFSQGPEGLQNYSELPPGEPASDPAEGQSCRGKKRADSQREAERTEGPTALPLGACPTRVPGLEAQPSWAPRRSSYPSHKKLTSVVPITCN